MEERFMNRLAGLVQGKRFKAIRHQRDISHFCYKLLDLKALCRIFIGEKVCSVSVLATLRPEHPTPPVRAITDYDHTITNLQCAPSAWSHHNHEEGRCKITRF